MNRKKYEELNEARLRLALRDAGYDRDVADCLKKFRADGWEFSLQYINGKWAMVFFGHRVDHFEPFDELEDAVYYAALSVGEKK